MALILFDTNIFIDMLGGCAQASKELNSYEEPAISVITYMELYSGAVARPNEVARIKVLLETFTVLPIDSGITEQAIVIRGNSLLKPPKIKLPDAIIGATAVQWRIPLITRNPQDFISLSELVPIHVPYDYESGTGAVINVRLPYRKSSTPSLMILK